MPRGWRLLSLVEVPSTIDGDAFAGDEVRLDEEEHRLGDFLGAAPAGERRGLDSPGIVLGSEVGRGENGAGRDGIDENLGSELERETLGDSVESAVLQKVTVDGLDRGDLVWKCARHRA